MGTKEPAPTTDAPPDGLVLRRSDLDGALFDMDGVVTSTAALHEAAWKATFDPLLRALGAAPFSHDDYRCHVDGKPRGAGVQDFLAARGIDLIEGDADDPAATTRRGLAAAKTRRFMALLKAQGATACPGAARLLAACRAAGLRVGLFTASKNAALVLKTTGLTDAFDARVDGVNAEALHLRGKPAPDAPLACAGMLGVAPRRCALFEDATAGIGAGRAGGFGRVIGVGRGDDARRLTAAGAHAVVADLARVVVEDA